MDASITSFFESPLMKVQLDLDLEKLTEFAFHVWEKDKDGVHFSNVGGYHSDDQLHIEENIHEEFIGLKKEINRYLQLYHSEVFKDMTFKGNIVQSINGMWVNINEKHHFNEWHVHPHSTLTGTYYIKHDGSVKNGNIVFKNPIGSYVISAHWPNEIIETTNAITSHIGRVTPKSNMLLIFPSWLEHKVEANLKNDSRISLSFNSIPSLEKKS